MLGRTSQRHLLIFCISVDNFHLFSTSFVPYLNTNGEWYPREKEEKYAVFQDGWDPAPPNEYAMCKLGAWDREIPRCVRPGCPDPAVARGVRAVEEIGGAVVRFFCSDPSQGTTLMFSLF